MPFSACVKEEKNIATNASFSEICINVGFKIYFSEKLSEQKTQRRFSFPSLLASQRHTLLLKNILLFFSFTSYGTC